MNAPNNSNFAKRHLILVAVGVLGFVTGCATHVTGSGGRETNVLGGAVTVSNDSFQPPTANAAVDVDTTKLAGKGDPSGRKISILWGLINLHDY